MMYVVFAWVVGFACQGIGVCCDGYEKKDRASSELSSRSAIIIREPRYDG